MKKKLKNQQGLSTLFLVFIIASLLALIIFTLQLVSLLAARRASQLEHSQTAFFTAEGAIYETIQHLRDDASWPGSFPYSDSYIIGEADIKRDIQKDEESDTLTIDITGTVKKAKRRLVVDLSYQFASLGAPLDVCLAIDKSYSMDDWSEAPGDEEPFNLAKDIAKEFVNLLDYSQDKVAILSFSTSTGASALPDYELSLSDVQSNDLDAIEGIIDGIDFAGFRKSITKAIVGCWYHEFQNYARDDAQQVTIVISDAHVDAGWPWQPPCDRYSCWSSVDTGFQPESAGTLCTDSAIVEARNEESAYGYKFVSLYIPNIPSNLNSDCGDGDLSEKLAKRTMEEIVDQGFPFFQEISELGDFDPTSLYAPPTEEPQIISSFKLREELPEPD